MKSPVQTYLARQNPEPLVVSVPVSPQLGMGVVIPCYNEPDLPACLESLLRAERPSCHVEVLVVVNAPSDAPAEAVAQNEKTTEQLAGWAARHSMSGFRILCAGAVFPAGKYAGVGLARKTGMDEMTRRLAIAGCADGLIVSLDADCRVSTGYFTALENRLARNRQAVAATLAFEHPLPADPALRQAMIQYELYLRYYRHALKYIGFPYAYYTIGSDFAVKASAYCRAGGMGKYQGGEDFYFLRKVFPLGDTVEINEAKVYPAARLSDRVPFGTGPSLIRLTERPDGVKLTYPWETFRWMRFFFSGKERWFRLTAGRIVRDWKEMRRPDTGEELPAPLLAYLEKNGWAAALEELGRNCASLPVFVRRFFDTFDGLRILQSLNALQEIGPLQPVAGETVRLLDEAYGIRGGDDPLWLLRILQARDEA